MTRREEINKQAVKEQSQLYQSPEWRAGFISGANWADKTTLDRACKWLEEKNKLCMYELEMILGGNFIDDFKKEMEGGAE